MKGRKTIAAAFAAALLAGPAFAKDRATEVCLSQQFIQPRNWDQLSKSERNKLKRKYKKAVKNAVKKANKIFKANKLGIKLKLSKKMPDLPRDAEQLKKQKAANLDPHCIELYLDPEAAGGAGLTEGENFSLQNLQPVPKGVDPDYQKALTMGESITMGVSFDKAQGDDINGNTVAHELGHAFGLGMGPTPDDHREIGDYSKKIANSANANSRLMRHRNPGNKLTDKEKELMKAMAEHWKKFTGTCSNAYHLIDGDHYVADVPSSDLIYASVTSTSAFLRFDAHFGALSPVDSTLSVTVELDTAADDQPDHRLSFFFDGSRWQNEHAPAATDPEGAPFAVRVFSQTLESTGVGRVIALVPRSYLPRDSGEVGWRLRATPPGAQGEETVPPEGFDSSDITLPSYEVALDPGLEEIRVSPGETVQLTGSIEANHQVSGPLEVASHTNGRVFNQKSIRKYDVDLEAGRWSASLRIRPKTGPGTYPFDFDVFCSKCQLSRTLETTVVVETPKEPGEG